MSNRRAQDERIEGTPDGSNAITEIVDIPDAPTIGTATAGLLNASVAFTPATTGGTVSTYTATSSPGSITGTSATSPITVNGLTGGTAYTFTVRGANSTGTGPASSASNSVTPEDLVGAYDSLATVTLSAATASVTFAGIPTGYKHLQLRWFSKNTSADYTIRVQFNSDTATNYSEHGLQGNGAAASAYGTANQAWVNFGQNADTTASTFAGGVVDVLDYANTNKYKTVRALSGYDKNGGGVILFGSGNWRSTSAISTIYLYSAVGNFAQYSQFALYGVK